MHCVAMIQKHCIFTIDVFPNRSPSVRILRRLIGRRMISSARVKNFSDPLHAIEQKREWLRSQTVACEGVLSGPFCTRDAGLDCSASRWKPFFSK